MRITRFADSNDDIYYGTDIQDNTATILAGDIYEGFQLTTDKKTVKKILPPLDPIAVLCIGLNYKAHAEETGADLPPYPVLFIKNPASVIGHNMPIILPASCREPLQVDYEAELAVVIGKQAKNVSAEKVKDYVAGYTIANDVSARIWQGIAGAGQWIRGKSFDTFCPLGPELITPEDVPDPDNLDLKCVLNGEVMQESNTSDMIFSTTRIISYLSEDTTLLPGTIILTGTPSGVGFTRKPPVYLKPGDTVEATVEKLGTLVNTVE